MTHTEFIDKWRQVELKERDAAQEHFLDLCRLLELPTPAEADPRGESFTFEKRVSKAAGGRGFADVWKRGHFAWEYKGRGKDLNAAYVQLLLYRDDLENPPLLVVSDIQRILVHTKGRDSQAAVDTESGTCCRGEEGRRCRLTGSGRMPRALASGPRRTSYIADIAFTALIA